MGNVNQVTPYGNLTYRQTGNTQWTDPLSGSVYDLPQYTARTQLSPDQRRLNRIQTEGETNLARLARDQSGRLGSILGRPMDTGGIPGVSAPQVRTVGQGRDPEMIDSYGTNWSRDRRRVENALMSRMNPALEQERDRLATQLSNQGIKLGTEAYDRAMQNFGQQSNDARMGAILAGGDEQSRLAGIARDAAGFTNAARQQGFDNIMNRIGFNNTARQQGFGNEMALRNQSLQELYAQRNQPINEIAALLGTGQVQNPMFVNANAPQVPTVDYAGLVNSNYNQRLAGWQQQQAQRQSLMGGLFGLGSAGIMASDERLKEDVEPVGAIEVPVYEYSYKGDDTGKRHIGVMAQDVAKVRPDAVVPMGRYLAVDYGKLTA